MFSLALQGTLRKKRSSKLVFAVLLSFSCVLLAGWGLCCPHADALPSAALAAPLSAGVLVVLLRVSLFSKRALKESTRLK